MLYGSLGVQIARAMLRTADAVGLGWNSKGLLEERTGYTNRLEPPTSVFCLFHTLVDSYTEINLLIHSHVLELTKIHPYTYMFLTCSLKLFNTLLGNGSNTHLSI